MHFPHVFHPQVLSPQVLEIQHLHFFFFLFVKQLYCDSLQTTQLSPFYVLLHPKRVCFPEETWAALKKSWPAIPSRTNTIMTPCIAMFTHSRVQWVPQHLHLLSPIICFSLCWVLGIRHHTFPFESQYQVQSVHCCINFWSPKYYIWPP